METLPVQVSVDTWRRCPLGLLEGQCWQCPSCCSCYSWSRSSTTSSPGEGPSWMPGSLTLRRTGWGICKSPPPRSPSPELGPPGFSCGHCSSQPLSSNGLHRDLLEERRTSSAAYLQSQRSSWRNSSASWTNWLHSATLVRHAVEFSVGRRNTTTPSADKVLVVRKSRLNQNSLYFIYKKDSQDDSSRTRLTFPLISPGFKLSSGNLSFKRWKQSFRDFNTARVEFTYKIAPCSRSTDRKSLFFAQTIVEKFEYISLLSSHSSSSRTVYRRDSAADVREEGLLLNDNAEAAQTPIRRRPTLTSANQSTLKSSPKLENKSKLNFPWKRDTVTLTCMTYYCICPLSKYHTMFQIFCENIIL